MVAQAKDFWANDCHGRADTKNRGYPKHSELRFVDQPSLGKSVEHQLPASYQRAVPKNTKSEPHKLRGPCSCSTCVAEFKGSLEAIGRAPIC